VDRWQVVIMAKAPVPGRVKTRLCPPLTHRQAARLATAALTDTLAAARASQAARCVLALDGDPGAWLPPGVSVLPQRQGDFGARLAGAMADTWAGRPLPLLVVGMDTPQLAAGLLDWVAAQLLAAGTDTVLGPADDGGYWVIAARRPVAGMFEGVPMSTASTGEAQLARLGALGLRCSIGPGLRDVDEFADAEAVAEAAPGTAFAREWRAMAPAVRATTAAVGGR